MATISQIFLDLDGVVVDYVGGCFKYFDLNATMEDMTEWGSVIDIYKRQTGGSKSEFFRAQGEEFWMGLDFETWATDLLVMLEPYKPTILTSPTLTSAGYRQAWIREYMPDYFNDKRYLIGPAKSSVAHREALLIDDKPQNIKDFINAGGRAIYFPQPWNVGLRACQRDRFAWFKSAFQMLVKISNVVKNDG